MIAHVPTAIPKPTSDAFIHLRLLFTGQALDEFADLCVRRPPVLDPQREGLVVEVVGVGTDCLLDGPVAEHRIVEGQPVVNADPLGSVALAGGQGVDTLPQDVSRLLFADHLDLIRSDEMCGLVAHRSALLGLSVCGLRYTMSVGLSRLPTKFVRGLPDGPLAVDAEAPPDELAEDDEELLDLHV